AASAVDGPPRAPALANPPRVDGLPPAASAKPPKSADSQGRLVFNVGRKARLGDEDSRRTPDRHAGVRQREALYRRRVWLTRVLCIQCRDGQGQIFSPPALGRDYM